MQYEWIVSTREAHVTLLQFLQGRLKDKALSMRKIKGWIDAGYCTIKGRPQRYRALVISGLKVHLQVPEQASRDIQFIYEDDAIVVINKPPGITCDDRLVKDLAKKNRQVELIHRLDKETTGILLCAKTSDVKKYFIEQFRSLLVEKTYVAVVDGIVGDSSGSIENYLGPIQRSEGHVKWGVVSRDGHLAATEWLLIKRAKNASLLSLMPKTGKTHQLRVHTSGMGHPILGDHTYGKTFRCPYKAPRVLLHAQKIAFVHPLTSKKVELACELPQDFESCIRDVF